jgi:hypothetical protein
METDKTITWLLRGDPAIRWQTLRDLTGANRRTWAHERQQICQKGWGRRLLARQDRSGMWGGGLYSPKWVSTTYTMLLLRRLGLSPTHPQAQAQAQGREFLLEHRLFRSSTSGAVVNPAMTRFSFPPRWHYDVLRGLDHFQEVAAERDERLSDAMELVYKKRRRDGRWPLQNRHPGRAFFEMEKVGRPSRWNTLRALRVVRWWERLK